MSEEDDRMFMSRQIAQLRVERAELLAVLKGMLMEWDKLTRYGSPIAKAANERVTAARAAITKAEQLE